MSAPKPQKRTRKKDPRSNSGKRKAPPVTLSQTVWDTGATGPANRNGLVIEDAADMDPETGKAVNPNNIKRARRVNMLEVWHRKGVISTAGFNAAEKLRDAFEATSRAPGWPDNDRVQSSPKPDHAVTIQIDRLSAFHAFHRHVTDEDREIIDACVLLGGSPMRIRRYRGGRGYQAGLEHLRAALDRLAIAIGG